MMLSLPEQYCAVVFGSTGGIGSAFVELLESDPRCKKVISLSRSSNPQIELTDESRIAEAAASIDHDLHLLIDATGFLSDTQRSPEKSMRHLQADNLLELYHLNAVGPAMLMKHFSHLMPRKGKSVFATLSARVGSTGDNQLGGWYSYRASKAALNALLKCVAIETARTRPDAVMVSIHPGTVATPLSDPFSANRDRMTPRESAGQMLEVLDRLGSEQTGSFWDYKGNPIDW